MSDFTTKFNLLIEIEKIANSSRVSPLTLFISDDVINSVMKCGEVYPFTNIIISNLDIEFYFDKNNKDGFHNLYDIDVIKIPYFKDMVFEDETMFILQDEYKIIKFIKLLEINYLEKFLSELKEV